MICSINGTRVAIKADLATSEHFLNSPQAPSALITIPVAATTSRVREKWFGSIGRFDPCNSYTRQAKLANENAQANASAISGGYGSSYGTQAGQSAYQNAMAGLSSATNSLYSQALNQYTQKKSDLQSQLSGYQQAEAQDYEKCQTNYQNWENQRNYYQSAYNQAASESQAKKSRSTGIFGTILSVAASLLPFLL